MKHIFVLFSFLLTTMTLQSQTGIPKAQAMFIYNFSRLIEWPVNYRSGPFIIGIFGGSEVSEELKTYTAGKKVGTQDMQIQQYKTAQEITVCHILFIPFSRTKQLPEILSALQGKSTLLVTEKNGSLDAGSAINFIILTDKIKFELKPDNLTKNGLKYSSKLIEMANSSQ